MPITTYEPDDVIDNDFKVREFLGSGFFSSVYKVYNGQRNRESVLKLIEPKNSQEDSLKYFQIECDALEGINHPHIAKLLSHGRLKSGILYIELEYIDGQTLLDLLNHAKAKNIIPPLSVRQTRQAALELLDALMYLHEGTQKSILHRDVKPNNLILNQTQGLVIIDFNVSKIFAADQPAYTKVGTSGYVPPEVKFHGEGWTPRSDLYSAGVVLYQMLTNNMPFDKYSINEPVREPNQFYPDIDPTIAEIVLKAIERDPERRFQSAREMKEDILSRWPVPVTDSSIVEKPAVIVSTKFDPDKEYIEIRDELDNWRKSLDKQPDAWPRYDRIKRTRDELEKIGSQQPERAEKLHFSLNEFCESLARQYQGAISSTLGRLQNLDKPTAAWREEMQQVGIMLEQLEQLAPDLAVGYPTRLQTVTKQLEGLELLYSAEKDVNETTSRLREWEKKGINIDKLVADANQLYKRIQDQLAEARSRQSPSELIERLCKLEEDCREFWDIRRSAYVEAVTADLDNKFADTYDHLKFVQKKEGAKAKVLYYSSLTDGVPHQVNVEEAIQVCELRWGAFLTERTRKHLEEAETKLDKGDPRGADDELKEVESPKKELELTLLDSDLKHRLNNLRKCTDTELLELTEFEQTVKEISAHKPAVKAWRALGEIDSKYDRFKSASRKWQNTYQEIRQNVSSKAWQDLKPVCSDIVSHKLVYAQQSAQQVYIELEPHQKDFVSEFGAAKILLNSISELDNLLIRAAQQLDEPTLDENNLDIATQHLSEAKNLLKKLAQNLPPELGRADLLKQEELQRLDSTIKVAKDASSLLIRLTEEAETTLSVSRLHNLMTELDQYKRRQTPGKFQSDFAALQSYVTARYSLLAAKQILEIEGDREEALQLLKQAKQEPRFEAEAEADIALIQNRLIKADKRVQSALKDIKRHLLAGAYWEAYSAAMAVRSEPAERRLKEQLAEEIRVNAHRARETSEEVIRQALDQNRGDAEELMKHAGCLNVLDPEAMQSLAPQLWPLIYRLAAEEKAKQGQWENASEYYRNAAETAVKASDPMGLTYRLKAKAAFKEHILQLCQSRLSPTIAVEFLETQLQGDYSGDPDLLLEKSKALERKGMTLVNSTEELEEDVDEVKLLRETGAILAEAKQLVELASEQADRWNLPGRISDYEKERLILLGQIQDQEAASRLDRTTKIKKRITDARWMAKRKAEIVKLLVSAEQSIAGITGR